ncbi:metal-dependent phosphohydrolase [Simiduia sp. 21SJ11W-1]|uniref:heme biosynthesis HemY N-terminal domain-containing protein n=1 Tax=Simiduia sp. 21SJ11W-1 TaxID=2909669 RepID=UPI0020A0D669|nr:heme biosynthesis HemY N-terminal domain-containing protein [Simiduia sp. 21SJ11W-1]UTA47775.1 metal-dependent phosphohydrolase [Simiduia sp. 21SJ11W-1]
MKRLVLLVAIALLAGGLLISELAKDSGYLLVSVYGYSLETSLWFAILALLIFGLMAWIVLRALFTVIRGFLGVTHYVMHGSEERNRNQLADGLVDFMEGNWKLARKKLLKSADRSIVPVINYLAAARAAYELGDRDEAQVLLAKAEQVGPQFKLATALAQARIELMDERYEQCLAALERVREETPNHPVVLDILRQSYVALEDWPSLQKLLPLLKKHKPLPEQTLKELEQRCQIYQLTQAVENPPNGDVANALHKVWQHFDTRTQRDADMLIAYTRLLVQHVGEADAEVLLRKALHKSWDDRLLDWYGRLKGEDVGKQLLVAEGWLRERPRNATLLLALGRLSLRNQLWGKAREYFESSLKLSAAPETYAELARLMAALGEHQLSTSYYQQGLKVIASDLPELPVPEPKSQFGHTGSTLAP